MDGRIGKYKPQVRGGVDSRADTQYVPFPLFLRLPSSCLLTSAPSSYLLSVALILCVSSNRPRLLSGSCLL